MSKTNNNNDYNYDQALGEKHAWQRQHIIPGTSPSIRPRPEVLLQSRDQGSSYEVQVRGLSLRSGSSHRSDTRRSQEDKQQSSPLQYSIAFSFITNLKLRLTNPICCHQHSSPFAVPQTAIAPSVCGSVLVKYHRTIVLQPFGDPPLGKHHCKTLLAIHSWAKPHCRISLTIYPWANFIAGLCSQSIFGQNSLQNFTCNLPLVNLFCP